MSEGLLLADIQDRVLAETTWDRNVVVVAGAGTGKTTILVNRILNLLMREPEPLAMTEIVALTFTNKAATEMKQRLRRELGKLVDRSDDEVTSMFRSRYHVTAEQVFDRAQAALAQLEKAQIGTLHSFAAHLLRLHPLESGADPSFREDDGARFKELFSSSWARWLDDELAAGAPHHEQWRTVLSGTTLDDLRGLAMRLAGDLVDLDELERQCRVDSPEGPLRDWLTDIHAKASRLLAERDRPKRRKAEEMLAATVRCLSLLLTQGPRGSGQLTPDERSIFEKELGKAPAGWDDAAFSELKQFVSLARSLSAVDQSYVLKTVTLLRPFLGQVRRAFLASGWISFDGLLAKAKALLRDHPSVRARIKGSYRAILVDEFQDTDPVQYEIILYLAERAGSHRASWQELELEPGKLFIVGDPKQSIYAFRRADIEAFERVVDKIKEEGGAVYSLATNFRSDAAVLDMVNGLFDRLFQPEAHIQPPNEQLTVRPNRKPEVSTAGVQLRLVTAEDDEEEFDAVAATRAEAEALALWLKEELMPGTTVVDRGRSGPLQPGHIAFVFRKLTQAQEYLDALRRHDIAYITDGEKHFYRRQEIIDLVNLLRVVDNPQDTIALVGLLRSPLCGIEDRDLVTLRALGCLDYERRERLAEWKSPRAASLGRLYDRLAELRRFAPLLPVPEAIELLFEQLPILELAAASLHGEQAVANLLKARDLAEAVADRPRLTLSGFVELMMHRLEEQPEEAESALSEETLDAVRILTIHKAKGLEFPVVVLPGLHQGSRNPAKAPVVHHDWSSRCYGLLLGKRMNFGALLVEAKMAAREKAEQRRLLYVGMTRARDLLVFSGGLTATPGQDTALSLLEGIVGKSDSRSSSEIEIGTGRMTRVVVPASVSARRSRPPRPATAVPLPVLTPLLTRQAARRDLWSRLRDTPRRVTPSLLVKEQGHVAARDAVIGQDAATARLVGICAHALLERWDFSGNGQDLGSLIDQVCRQYLPPDQSASVETVIAELETIFASFLASKPYRTLQRGTILGREVPFVMPWGDGQIMEGVIDLIYRLDDKVWIADYKTDSVPEGEIEARAALYGSQAKAYTSAVAQALGEAVAGFQVLFLRHGVAVPLLGEG
jgi:ATP-dependent helicase/nuclease subunit A